LLQADHEVALFGCDVQPNREAAYVIPVGEIDVETAPIVGARLDDLRDAGFRRLVLDLRHVSFMDLSGLHLILGWSAAPSEDGLVSFDVIPGPTVVQRIFHLTKTADRVKFVDGSGAPSPVASDGLLARSPRSGGTPLTDRLIPLFRQGSAHRRHYTRP
jgi:anti-anti-sigma factor